MISFFQFVCEHPREITPHSRNKLRDKSVAKGIECFLGVEVLRVRGRGVGSGSGSGGKVSGRGRGGSGFCVDFLNCFFTLFCYMFGDEVRSDCKLLEKTRRGELLDEETVDGLVQVLVDLSSKEIHLLRLLFLLVACGLLYCG